MSIVYFGCEKVGEPGHHAFAVGMRKLSDSQLGLSMAMLDHMYDFVRGLPNGHAVLTNIGNRWTVLGFTDNSVDGRQGSHSQFLFDGKLSFAEALYSAKRNFAMVFARFKFEVVEANTNGFVTVTVETPNAVVFAEVIMADGSKCEVITSAYAITRLANDKELTLLMLKREYVRKPDDLKAFVNVGFDSENGLIKEMPVKIAIAEGLKL